jgi:regulator of nonsense transcripts 1
MALSLIASGQTPLRIGSISKIHKSIMPYHVMQQVYLKFETTKGTKEKIECNKKRDLVAEIVGKSNVICSTCIGAMHKDLKSLDPKKVGLIIMDEATQASEPECLVPLTAFNHARVVLIGDQMQLPPTMLSDAVRRSNEEYSLFGRLIEKTGETGQDFTTISRTMLRTQYRMHPEIASFSNQRFYGGNLHNGVTTLDRNPLPPKNLWPVVDKKRSPILFIQSTKEEDRNTNTASFSNRAEAEVVAAVVRRLLQCGVLRRQIGVITPYMGQVRLLRQLFTSRGVLPFASSSNGEDILEVNSVDAFQGSEVSLHGENSLHGTTRLR